MSSDRLPPPRLRVASLCLCIVLIVTFAGVSPPAAVAASLSPSGALSELTGGQEASPTQTTATTPSTESTTSSSKSKSVVILALAAAVALLAGIAFVIVRDARKVAPGTEVQLAEGSSPRHSEERLRRRRARAKAARRQRKRNR